MIYINLSIINVPTSTLAINYAGSVVQTVTDTGRNVANWPGPARLTSKQFWHVLNTEQGKKKFNSPAMKTIKMLNARLAQAIHTMELITASRCYSVTETTTNSMRT